MKNFMGLINDNKKVIWEKALVVGGVIAGLVIGGYLLTKPKEIKSEESEVIEVCRYPDEFGVIDESNND